MNKTMYRLYPCAPIRIARHHDFFPTGAKRAQRTVAAVLGLTARQPRDLAVCGASSGDPFC